MTVFGFNYDIKPHRSMASDLDLIKASGCTLVRYPLRWGNDNALFLTLAHNRRLRVMGIIDRDALKVNGSSAEASFLVAAQAWKNRLGNGLDILQVGNEQDHSHGVSSWTMTKVDFDRLLQAFRSYFFSTERIAGGLASGDPNWLSNVNLYDYALAVHPYTKRPNPTWPSPTWGTGYQGDLLNAYRARIGSRTMHVTEHGCTLPEFDGQASTEARKEELRAEYTWRQDRDLHARGDIGYAILFCLLKDMVPPYGVVDGTSPLLTYHAHASTVKELNPVAKVYNIGQGVRDLMARLGDVPRGDEIYFHLQDGQTAYSLTMGRDRQYRWTPEDGTRCSPDWTVR